MMYTAARETGDFLEEVNNLNEGLEFIKAYEEEDRRDGTYTPNFYDVVNEDHESLLFGKG